MAQLAGWLSSNTATLSILGAAVAFIWSTTLQVAQRKVEAGERQFQAFHKLVKELVSPDPADGALWIDRQAAVLFELRHFPRYYEFTERMLVRLRSKWVETPHGPALAEEIDGTLKHIQQSK
jgi:hypothetical protein